jgi:hypothetical protein
MDNKLICIYCKKECKDKETIESELKEYVQAGGNVNSTIDENYISMFGLDKPIHLRCLKDAIVGIKYVLEDYPQLKNAVMLLCKNSKQLKDYKWSQICSNDCEVTEDDN